MDIALLAARVLLAIVFLGAGLAKLADRAGSRRALVDFGLPETLASPFGMLLPLVELAAGVALLPAASAWWGALGALVLLLLFVAGIGFNLARGRRPECHCFGQVASGPIGWSTLARNVILAAVGSFVLWQGQGHPELSTVSWLNDLTVTERAGLVILAVVVALLAVEAWGLLQVVRQSGRMLVRLETLEARVAGGSSPPAAATPFAPAAPAAGLPVGTPAPAFTLPGLHGETLTLDALRAAGKPVLLTFTDPNCGPCTALLPELVRWQRELASVLTLTLISRGAPEENRAKSVEYGVAQMLVQKDREVMQAYQAAGTPSALLVQSDGTIGSPLAQGVEEIGALVARMAAGGAPAMLPLMPYPPPANGAAPCPHCGQYHDQQHAGAAPAMPQGLPAGTPAPALKLPDLTGQTIDLEDYRGRETLLLFWSTRCGFCQQLLPELKAWEANHPEKAPALLVVATGSAEENAAQGLASTIVLDEGFSAGTAFGAGGTPSGVLVGTDGRIASPLAVGGPAVMALANGQDPQAAAPQANGAAPAVAKVGDPAPAFSLPSLSGETVSLADFHGSSTLLLFWNPGCGFCQQLLSDLKAWEAKPPRRAPKLLVVSSGTATDNQAQGFTSPVALDEGFKVGSAFGVNGTPSAVLVDAEGKIAAPTAVGGAPVLELARRGK